MQDLISAINQLPVELRLATFIGVAVGTHLLVKIIRKLANLTLSQSQKRYHRFRKAHSLITLASSAMVFSLYFLAIGLALRELGISLTAYLASASVVGLAIGFGSQGVVQDVVSGLTFIFSDLVDVGDMVEISDQTGIVRAITMRFVQIENSIGANVYVPNRSITSVVNYPRGYVRCLVDVTLLGDGPTKDGIADMITDRMRALYEQFPGIFIAAPSLESRFFVHPGKEIARVKFRIWPNRGEPIESSFVNELAATLKRQNADYEGWMIAITYEVEKRAG